MRKEMYLTIGNPVVWACISRNVHSLYTPNWSPKISTTDPIFIQLIQAWNSLLKPVEMKSHTTPFTTVFLLHSLLSLGTYIQPMAQSLPHCNMCLADLNCFSSSPPVVAWHWECINPRRPWWTKGLGVHRWHTLHWGSLAGSYRHHFYTMPVNFEV